jgi:hypothetical protein
MNRCLRRRRALRQCSDFQQQNHYQDSHRIYLPASEQLLTARIAHSSFGALMLPEADPAATLGELGSEDRPFDPDSF